MSGLYLPSPLLACPGAAPALWVAQTRSFPCNTSWGASAQFLPFWGEAGLMVSGGIAPGLLGTAQPCRSCCCLRNAPLMPCGISGQGARAGQGKSAGAGVPLAFVARLRVLLGWFMAKHPPDLAVVSSSGVGGEGDAQVQGSGVPVCMKSDIGPILPSPCWCCPSVPFQRAALHPLQAHRACREELSLPSGWPRGGMLLSSAAQDQRCGPCPCSGRCPHHPAVPLTYPKVGGMRPWRPWPCSRAAGRSGSIVCHPVSAQVRPPPGDPVPARFYGHDWHLRLFAEGRGHTRSCQLPAASDPLWDTVNLPVGGSRGCSGHGAVVHIVSDGGVQPGTWPGPVPTGAKMGLAARDHEQQLGKRCCA